MKSTINVYSSTYRVLLLLSVVLLTNISTKAQRIEGSEFWFVMPQPNSGLAVTYGLVIQSNYYAKGNITFPALPAMAPVPFSVTPGQQTVINLPASLGGGGGNIYPDANNVVQKKCFKILSDSLVTVYGVNYENASADGETVLPIELLGTSYVVASRATAQSGLNYGADIIVAATEDNTNVTIKTWNNVPADVTYNIVLNKGQTYKCNTTKAPPGNHPAREMNTSTGSLVNSNKPIVVMGATKCTRMIACGACDIMMTQMLPMIKWGKKYVLAQALKRAPETCLYEASMADYVEIVGTVGQSIKITNSAGVSNVTIPALPFATANTNYSFLFYQNPIVGGATGPEAVGEANLILESAQPFQVVQYMKDLYSDNIPTADPDGTVIYPDNMWESDYLTSTLNLRSSQVTLVTPIAGVGTISLDGTVIPASSWQNFASNTYSFARMPVAPLTTHKMVSSTGVKFGVYVIGVGGAESYQVQGGGKPEPILRTVPINILSFITQVISDKVLLKWSTASEQNCEGYVVERSKDGINYTQIGKLSGAGNSSITINYSFTDAIPFKGINYYRLKQRDLDGKTNILGVRVVEFKSNKVLSLLNLAPNPIKGEKLTVSINVGSPTPIIYQIVDITGRVVFKGVWDEVIEGENKFSMDMNIERGIYYLIAQKDDSDEMIKVKLVKE